MHSREEVNYAVLRISAKCWEAQYLILNFSLICMIHFGQLPMPIYAHIFPANVSEHQVCPVVN